MADKISTEGGASIRGDANTGGGNLSGRDDRTQTMRAGDTYVGTQEGFPVWRLLEMAADIRALVAQMDDLPFKVGRLTDQVGRLERLEVVVKPGPPPEVIVRPVTHDTVNLSIRMIVVIFSVALVAVLALVAWLVFLQVANV